MGGDHQWRASPDIIEPELDECANTWGIGTPLDQDRPMERVLDGVCQHSLAMTMSDCSPETKHQ